MTDTEITGTNPESGGLAPGSGGLGWKPIAMVFIIVSAALGGILVYGQLTEPNFEPMDITATINIDYGNGTVATHTITTDNYTAFGFLEAVVGFENIDATYYESFNSWLINSINGVQNGADIPGIADTSAYYWQYYVNDELGPVGADRYALLDGDVLEWRFEEIVW